VPAVPSEHDHECPADHHHDSCCCSHALTLVCEFDDACALMPSKSSIFGMRHQSVKIPNGPFLISEKPPLIYARVVRLPWRAIDARRRISSGNFIQAGSLV
jgi:hypothetical protein